MRKTKHKPMFEVGNQVHVKTASGLPGDTFFTITKLLPRCGCLIRQDGTAPNGQPYAEQRWDTSMLVHAVTDELLAALSCGAFKAVRPTTTRDVHAERMKALGFRRTRR